MKDEYKFDSPGTLPKPKIIGRFVRLLLAFVCLYTLYIIIHYHSVFIYDPPREALLWAIVLWALFLLPPVFNIGFGIVLHSQTQFYFVIAYNVLAFIDYNFDISFLPATSGYLLFALPFYVFAHLGISLLLAAVLATPGCEMRSIPHLYTIITGKQTREHYCPGFFDNLDKWELKSAKSS